MEVQFTVQFVCFIQAKDSLQTGCSRYSPFERMARYNEEEGHSMNTGELNE